MKLPDNLPKIKRGQIWKKKDTGYTVVISNRSSDDYWSTKPYKTGNNTRRRHKRAHHIKTKDLYLWYELLG